jgi:urease accessory protein
VVSQRKRAATQHLVLRAAQAAVIEWLPRETIVYDGAVAELDSRIELAGNAVFIGWDIVCLGRTASGERFRQGLLRQRLSIAQRWRRRLRRARARGRRRRLLSSPVGLNARTVFAHSLLPQPQVSDTLLAACRKVVADGEGAVTRLPGVHARAVSRSVGRASARLLRTTVAPCATAAGGTRRGSSAIWNT